MAAQLNAEAVKNLEQRAEAAEARAAAAEAQVKAVLAGLSGSLHAGAAAGFRSHWPLSADAGFLEELSLQRDAAQVKSRTRALELAPDVEGKRIVKRGAKGVGLSCNHPNSRASERVLLPAPCAVRGGRLSSRR
jgi:hypothetical protein